jgi:hypothetical protein
LVAKVVPTLPGDALCLPSRPQSALQAQVHSGERSYGGYGWRKNPSACLGLKWRPDYTRQRASPAARGPRPRFQGFIAPNGESAAGKSRRTAVKTHGAAPNLSPPECLPLSPLAKQLPRHDFISWAKGSRAHTPDQQEIRPIPAADIAAYRVRARRSAESAWSARRVRQGC